MRRYRKPKLFLGMDGRKTNSQHRTGMLYRTLGYAGVASLTFALINHSIEDKAEFFDLLSTARTSLLYNIEHSDYYMIPGYQMSGTSPSLEDDLKKIINIDFPISIFHLDQEQIIKSLQSVPEVETVRIKYSPTKPLDIIVTPSIPALVWEKSGSYYVVSTSGRTIATVFDPSEEPDLPLVRGEGADRAAHEIPSLMRAIESTRNQVTAWIRVGERRWDVQINNKTILMLSENDPYSGIKNFIDWETQHALISRSLERIDFRIPDDPVFRIFSNDKIAADYQYILE